MTRKNRTTRISGRRAGPFGVFLLIAIAVLPLLAVASSVVHPETDIWRLLARTTLATQIRTTLVLAGLVAVGTTVLGGGLAWLVTAYRFTGSRLLARALVLPMAMPGYVMAFIVVGWTQPSGPLQRTWRNWFGTNAWFPEVRSVTGASVVLILALYPYVYLPATAAFVERSNATSAAARTLGLGPWRTWLRVVVPASRPALVAGAALAVMETVTDIGVARIFSLQTMADAMLRVWFGLDRRDAAAELSLLLVGLVLTVIALERALRGRASFRQSGITRSSIEPTPLRGWRGRVASAGATLPVLFGFVLPVAQLIVWAVRATQRGGEGAFDSRFFALTRTTVMLSAAVAILAVGVAMVLVLTRQGRVTHMFGRVASAGYAVPGLVIAAGTLAVLGWVDRQFDRIALWDERFYVPFLFVGSIAGVLYGLTVRFLAVARAGVDAGVARLDPRIIASAATLGAPSWSVFWRVQLPILRRSLLVAGLLVALDCLKELPTTLLLRPAGKDTLSVFVWNMTNESRWEEAAAPALCIVAIGAPLVFFLLRPVLADAPR